VKQVSNRSAGKQSNRRWTTMTQMEGKHTGAIFLAGSCCRSAIGSSSVVHLRFHLLFSGAAANLGSVRSDPRLKRTSICSWAALTCDDNRALRLIPVTFRLGVKSSDQRSNILWASTLDSCQLAMASAISVYVHREAVPTCAELQSFRKTYSSHRHHLEFSSNSFRRKFMPAK
jgi:hypothetical protein